MIFDSIRCYEKNRTQYGNAVRRALDYLSALDTSNLPSRQELEGNKMYVMLQSPVTEAFEERLAEAHLRHADIHLVLEGEEWQGFAASSEGNVIAENKLADSDYALFRHVENEGRIRLRPGDFSIYWPGEIHRPNCHLQGPIGLTKLVVKIHRDLFGETKLS